jgi:serine/threonine-protein kinase
VNGFPDRLDRYELLVPIASGGMATVILARMRGMRGFEREVAVKRMHAHLRNADSIEPSVDLLEEAKLAALIRHPNVVPVLDVGEDEDGVYLVMPYIEGASLAALIRGSRARRERMSVPVVLRILSDVLAGLTAAHEQRDGDGAPLRLVHRDFSPQNILVGIDGVTLLTDFGIAKAANSDSVTQEGLVKGKVGYMSPEQVRGQPLDRRSDVWATGVVAWEAFAQQRLFASQDAVATAFQICSDRPRRLSSVRPDVPEAVDEAIAWALTPDLEARCPTAEDFRRRLLEAWDVPPADATDVAALVRELAGADLTALRARADEALRARGTAAIETPVVARSSAEEPTTVVVPATPDRLPTTSRSRPTRRIVAGLGVALALTGALALARPLAAPREIASPLTAPEPVMPAPTAIAAAPAASLPAPPPIVAAATISSEIRSAPASPGVKRAPAIPPPAPRAAVARKAPEPPPAAPPAPRVNTSLLGENPYEKAQ